MDIVARMTSKSKCFRVLRIEKYFSDSMGSVGGIQLSFPYMKGKLSIEEENNASNLLVMGFP
jgi:hypothetical protein